MASAKAQHAAHVQHVQHVAHVQHVTTVKKHALISRYGAPDYQTAISMHNAHKAGVTSLIQRFAPGGTLTQAKANQAVRQQKQILTAKYGASTYAEARALNVQHKQHVSDLIAKYAPGQSLAVAQQNKAAHDARAQTVTPSSSQFQLTPNLFGTSGDPGTLSGSGVDGSGGFSSDGSTPDTTTPTSGLTGYIELGVLAIALLFVFKKLKHRHA